MRHDGSSPPEGTDGRCTKESHMPTISARLPTIVGIEALKREYQTLGGLVDMNWAAAKKELWNVLHVVIKGDESGPEGSTEDG